MIASMTTTVTTIAGTDRFADPGAGVVVVGVDDSELAVVAGGVGAQWGLGAGGHRSTGEGGAQELAGRVDDLNTVVLCRDGVPLVGGTPWPNDHNDPDTLRHHLVDFQVCDFLGWPPPIGHPARAHYEATMECHLAAIGDELQPIRLDLLAKVIEHRDAFPPTPPWWHPIRRRRHRTERAKITEAIKGLS